MNPSPALLGAVVTELPKHNRSFGKLPGLLLSDVLIIVGIGLGLLIVLSLGIYLWMKSRRRRRRHLTGGEKVYRDTHSQPEESVGVPEPQPALRPEADPDHTREEEHHSRRRYKYRVRRRTHRSRNPTLSETGGLPPVRSQEPGKTC